ncbi:unnamed protein product [Triticum turgidum subsp. durum]|uniref:Uncharacterized protein n=1 Tax=Triticum turgidum subsp. durum TaxID=4567 RepID=A0A9R1C259_TRITD|nr:unnamed protein product [Triticum turgidum subsp. durum]
MHRLSYHDASILVDHTEDLLLSLLEQMRWPKFHNWCLHLSTSKYLIVVFLFSCFLCFLLDVPLSTHSGTRSVLDRMEKRNSEIPNCSALVKTWTMCNDYHT